jgi:GT2 family glycosyltransferase
MDISIIIVSWNVREKLRQNLNALLASVGVKIEVFVVDNNSGDGTVDMLASDFPSVTVIANQENLGFAKACNQGIRVSGGRYILLLNPDMKVFPETLAKTVAWLDENTQAAIAGIQLVNENGDNIKQIRRFPALFDQSLVAAKLAHLFPFLMNRYLCADFNYSVATSVDSIRGAFFVIRRSALGNIGLLDERYFLWFEEVDYCRRAKNIELEVWYTPVAQAVDNG